MKRGFLAAALLAAWVPVAVGQTTPAAQGQSVVKARATIAGTGITGTAEFTEVAKGTGREVQVVVKVTGLTPGLHGMHLHAVGKCEPPFTSAGGHFDPGPYGHTDPDTNHPFHMGDLPNVDADGTALIIHANPDQGITGPEKSGVSGGPRVACGVIERVK